MASMKVNNSRSRASLGKRVRKNSEDTATEDEYVPSGDEESNATASRPAKRSTRYSIQAANDQTNDESADLNRDASSTQADDHPSRSNGPSSTRLINAVTAPTALSKYPITPNLLQANNRELESVATRILNVKLELTERNIKLAESNIVLSNNQRETMALGVEYATKRLQILALEGARPGIPTQPAPIIENPTGMSAEQAEAMKAMFFNMMAAAVGPTAVAPGALLAAPLHAAPPPAPSAYIMPTLASPSYLAPTPGFSPALPPQAVAHFASTSYSAPGFPPASLQQVHASTPSYPAAPTSGFSPALPPQPMTSSTRPAQSYRDGAFGFGDQLRRDVLGPEGLAEDEARYSRGY